MRSVVFVLALLTSVGQAGARPIALDDPGLPDGWVNFYRRDDVSATAYFYLDLPAGIGVPLAPVAERTAGLP